MAKRVTKRMLSAGSEILYERVAEAFDDSYQELLARIYAAMRAAEKPGRAALPRAIAPAKERP